MLLQTLKQMNIDRYTDGRKHRNSLIFRKVCARHREAGFARSCDQVKHRWKTLKSIYYKAKKQSSSSSSFRHFDTMEEIFGYRPLVLLTTPSSEQNHGSPRGEDEEEEEEEEGEWSIKAVLKPTAF